MSKGTKTNETVTVEYTSSVLTNAGWRSVTVTATAEKLSEKRVEIIEVTDIDGNGCTGYASRTGANRQKYNVKYFADKEAGKTKNISRLKIV